MQTSAITTGGILSTICYVLVFLSYYLVPATRRHPNNLILYKSVFGFFFCMQFIITPFKEEAFWWEEFMVAEKTDTCNVGTSSRPCAVLSFFNQFFALGAELCYLALSMDLHGSLSNPFNSYKTNMRQYKAGIFLGSTVSAFILLLLGPKVYGLTCYGVCWIQTYDDHSFNFHMLFLLYAWVFLIYGYGMIVLVTAQNRLSKGLPKTLTTRRCRITKGRAYVFGYTLYWIIPGVMLVVWIITDHKNAGDGQRRLLDAVEMMLSLRGIFTLAIWTFINWSEMLHYLQSRKITELDDKLSRKKERDAEPHLNKALRAEILFYTTAGMIQSAKRATERRNTFSRGQQSKSASTGGGGGGGAGAAETTPAVSRSDKTDFDITASEAEAHRHKSVISPEEAGWFLSEGEDGDEVEEGDGDGESSVSNPLSQSPPAAFRTKRSSGIGSQKVQVGVDFHTKSELGRKDSASQMVDSEASIRADKDEFKCSFRDYCPQIFHNIRSLYGIESGDYCDSLSQTTKERFSEGASGAFLYFSADRRYIVKTTTHGECAYLRSILSQYYQYLKRNPDSLVAKFFGCHAIRMYGQWIYFVVMENIFCSDRTMHERYDLKGSWVNRHAGRPPKKFKGHNRFALTGDCLKDSDIKRRVELPPDEASALCAQLRKDVDFLCALGIMDYSLLMGINRRQFEVLHTKAAVDQVLSANEILSPHKLSGPARVTMGSPVNPSGTSTSTSTSNGNGNGSSGTGAGGAGTGTNGKRGSHRASLKAVDGFNDEYDGGSGARAGRFSGPRGMRAAVVEGPGVYYMGIIDMLQEWNFSKKMERAFKVYVLGQDRDGISAAPPQQYRDRFVQRVIDEVVAGDAGMHVSSTTTSTSNSKTSESSMNGSEARPHFQNPGVEVEMTSQSQKQEPQQEQARLQQV